MYKYNKPINKHLFFIELFIETYSLYSKDLIFFILFTILFTISITDYINQDVYSIFNYLLDTIMYFLLKPNISNLLMSLIIPLILFILNKFMNGMGYGDIELLASLSFVFGLTDLVKIIFLASLINLIYAFFYKKDSYSFVPFISISCLFIYLFR